MKRAIYKTITYRLVGSLSTFFIAYFTTNRIDVGIYMSITDLLWKPILYFGHEIIWSKLPLK